MIYVVGHNLGPAVAGMVPQWELIGVFTRKELAIAACLTPEHWIGPGTLDVAIHGPPTAWAGSWFPLLEQEPVA